MPEEIITTGTDNTGATAPATASTTTETIAKPSALASLEKVSAAASSAESAAIDPTTGKPKVASAGTTVQPGQPGANTGATGEDAAWQAIPDARKNIILENTRKKAREEATAELETQYGWAKGLDRELVSAGAGLATRIHSDPVTFAVQLIREIQADPRMAPALQQALGVVGVAPVAGQPNAFRTADGKFIMPKGKLRAEDGKTGAYSEEQVIEAMSAFEEHLMEKFGGRVAPLEEAHATAAEREEVINVIHQARQDATSMMAEMRALPQWPKDGPGKEGEQKIAGWLAKIPQERRERIGATASMFEAFNAYLQNDVFPTLQSTTSQQVRDDLRRKAAAGTGTVVPGAAQPSGEKKSPTNVTELAADLERRFAAAAAG